jgi:outer membrane protein assembly factor BamA
MTAGRPIVSYNADLGLVLGYALELQSYGFRKDPYATSHKFAVGWAFGRQGGRIDYQGDFRRENRSTYFGLRAFTSGVEVLRFYGFGNETQAPAADQNFYKVNATQVVLYPTFNVPLGKKALFSIGPALKYTSNDQSKDQYINTAQPYGVGKFGELGVHGTVSYDGRNSAVFPRSGLFAAVRGTYYAKAWDVTSDFGQVNGNVNAYLSAGRTLTLALRAGGKKVWGTYPYMEGASLGQGLLGKGALAEPENTLRGYRARFFLGDSSAFANADLRLRISHLTLIVPGAWGLTGFGDVGRVWLKGQSSDTWHTGVGGGLWVSLLADRIAFSGGLSHSVEENFIYFTGGFHF